MIPRVASFGSLPPIPGDLRLWYGDTWLFHHGWASGLKVGKMRHVFVFHERSATVGGNLSPVRHVTEADQEEVRLGYPWLKKRRRLVKLHLIPRPRRPHVVPFIRSREPTMMGALSGWADTSVSASSLSGLLGC